VTVPVFSQNVIAVIWDFDKTLLPGNMQQPLFKKYGVVEDQFWKEVKGLGDFYREQGNKLVATDTIYLSHVLTYVQQGIFGGLNNALLRQFGKRLKFYEGMPEFMAELKDIVKKNETFRVHDIEVEHYVISTGFRQTILGSPFVTEGYVEQVWGCEFVEVVAPPDYLTKPPTIPKDRVIQAVAYAIDNTTKTRAIFEINKGTNKFPKQITVNSTIAQDDRRVPFPNMIYIADGPSDVPVFSILNQYGGRTFAVYNEDEDDEFKQVADLRAQGRVQDSGPANYTSKTHTGRTLRLWVEQMAQSIVDAREQRMSESVGTPPTHLAKEPAGAPEAESPLDKIERSPSAREALEPPTSAQRAGREEPPRDRRRRPAPEDNQEEASRLRSERSAAMASPDPPSADR
jgi:hypothetical protein